MSGWTPIEARGGMKHSNGPAAVKAGDFVFLSSVKGVDPETQFSDPDPVTQIRQAMSNIDVVLKAASLEMGDIAKVTVFLEGYEENRQHLDLVWGETFESGTPPARATIAVESVGTSEDPSIALFDVVAYDPQT
jgi:enamine deaminase RidA (YjgF/YER057c/UK114 family)